MSALYKGSLKQIFQMMEEDNDGMCRPSAFPKFERWKPPPYLQDPDENADDKLNSKAKSIFEIPHHLQMTPLANDTTCK